MDLHTNDLATDWRTRREELVNNFKQVQAEDATDDAEREKLDQKYSGITNKLKERCTNLEEGEEKLDSDKASKVMLYKWWKELDDKFSACVDELDDKKASKKHVRRAFEALSQLIQQYHDDIVKIANDNEQKMNDKAERVALGTDMDTVRQAVTMVLQEQGIISNDLSGSNIPDTSDIEKKG